MKKLCAACANGTTFDYKDVETLTEYIKNYKLVSKRKSGLCDEHYGSLKTAVIRAGYMALIPQVVRPDKAQLSACFLNKVMFLINRSKKQ